MLTAYFFKKLLSLFCITQIFSTALLPRMGLENYQGTWKCVNKDYREKFSPFYGAINVENRVTEKMLAFGKVITKKTTSKNGLITESVIDGDATIKLLWHLFKTEGNQLSHRTEKTHIAGYLKPVPIGQLLQAIENNPKKTTLDAKNLEVTISSIMWRAVIDSSSILNTIEEWLKEMRNRITEDKQAITQWFSHFYGGSIDPFGLKITIDQANVSLLYDLLKWGQKEVSRQQKLIKAQQTQAKFNRKKAYIYSFGHFAQPIPKNYKSKIKKAHEYWVSKQNEIASKEFQKQFETTKKTFSRKKRAFLAADIRTCVTLITQALTECGHFQENKQQTPLYPPNTVYQTFLSLLYFTIENPSDLTTYFDQFKPSILQKEFSLHQFDYIKIKEQAQKFFAGSQEDTRQTKQKEFIENNFEETCILGLLNKGSGFPSTVRWEYISDFKGPVLASCGEGALFNWVRYLLATLGLYNSTLGVFNIEDLEKALVDRIHQKKLTMHLGVCKIKDFFKNNIPNNNANLTQGKVFQAWAIFITNLSDMKYLRRYSIKEGDIVFKQKVSQLLPLMRDSKTNVYKDYGKNEITPCPDDAFLAELAGCPSNYVNIVNYLFGLHFQSFKDLCSFFDLKPEEQNVISDNALYSGELDCPRKDGFGNTIKSFLLHIQCSINKKEHRFCIEIDKGHTDIWTLDDNNSCTDPYKLASTIKQSIEQSTAIGTIDLYSALSCYQSMCIYETISDFNHVDTLGCNTLFFLKDLLSPNIDKLKESIVFAVNSNITSTIGFERLIAKLIEYSKEQMQKGDVDCIKNTIIDIMTSRCIIQKDAIAALYALGTFFTSYNNEKVSEWLHYNDPYKLDT